MIDRDKRHPEKRNKPFNPIKRKPEWIRSKIVDSQVFFQTQRWLFRGLLVHTENNYPGNTLLREKFCLHPEVAGVKMNF